ncbi:SpaH/EbpB family LPXTG-anchored major pilin [Schaalia vaccimaxillae]|uniref:SpaH/EbpB family LPXTG-anchored major pilin n=1 Tax=Schaalia vaccimaxillae TaxID=183916 RepID=UPI0003B5A2D2|nr:SpaH/EbpB family LPXTG-anchored major pilin [Schaalia vaccimaxillae]
MTTKKTRRGISLLAAFAIAAGGFALPVAAMAADPELPSLIDVTPGRTGTLTIHKYLQTEDNGVVDGNGQPQDMAGQTPVPGVVYKVERLSTIDLTTQAGWETLVGYNNNVATARAGGVDPAPADQTTGPNGTATFANLPIGAYIVTEVSVPAGYTASDPFLITVPMTNVNGPDGVPGNADDNTTWDYEPDVYPKNPQTGIEKTVEDTNSVAVGSTIDYTLKSDIPKLADGQKLNYYTVVDQYDARLTLSDQQKGAIKLTLTDGTSLQLGVDYTLSYIDAPFAYDDGEPETTNDNFKRVTAEFTETGRQKLLDQRIAGDGSTNQVIMTFTATVAQALSPDGIVDNTAMIFPDKPRNDWDPKTNTTPPPDTPPSSKVESKFGKVKINKVGPDGNTPLDGAEFQVFKCTGPTVGTANFTPGNYTLVDSDADAGNPDGNAKTPLTVGGQTTFVTVGGTVTIDSLQNNDWEDGKAIADNNAWDWYCLVETKAPSGYELQTKPLAFQITQANSTKDNEYQIEAKVTNVPSNAGFKLPLTGAAGVGVLLTAGVLLVGGAGAIAYANKRRKDQES